VTDQRLPLPIGSPHPVRRWRRDWSARLDSRGRAALAVLGVAAAGTGAYLGAVPPAVTVGLDSGGYHVSGTTYPARGGGVYAGPAGAVVIVQEAGGRTRAGASTNLDGVPMVGACALPRGGGTERCSFQLDGSTVGATDRLTNGGWDRRYDDGATVRIPLQDGRSVPVPFALGR
jgi:hypothetical protein